MQPQSVLEPAVRIAPNYSGTHRSAYFACKRALDLMVSVLAHITFLPVLICIAIAIKLDSPGPVLFVQERVGSRRRTENGYTWWEPCAFNFYKFRTMRADVDQELHRKFMEAYIAGDEEAMRKLQPTPGAASGFKLNGDKRITRIGKFLRKTSLDELPQLWNVIRGDMSVVGPRPAIPYEVESYSAEHVQRLNAIPGITGLWQVSGRAELSFDEAIQLDLEYIEKQSIWFDLKILLFTVKAVLSGRGAG